MRPLVICFALLLLTAGPASAVELSIRPSEREPLWPDRISISGAARDYSGPVALVADEFPYEGEFREVGRTTTGERGRYRFAELQPRRDTRYRVTGGGARSGTVTVYVHPGVRIGKRRVGTRRWRISFTYLGHPGFRPVSNRLCIYLYDARTRRPVIRRLGECREMGQVSDGVHRAVAVVRTPRGHRTRSGDILFCSPGLSADGYGRAYRIDRHCGERTVPFPNPY